MISVESHFRPWAIAIYVSLKGRVHAAPAPLIAADKREDLALGDKTSDSVDCSFA